MLRELFRKKSFRPAHPESLLSRSFTALDLVLLGIGAIIGAGIFVLTGIAAATKAGPAITLSYLIAGLASLFAALAYAELAACIGGTGSAYNYAYSGFGEFIAWIIGWDLLLEYSMSVSTVAIGWSGYVNNLLQSIQIQLPQKFISNPFEGGLMNFLAMLIILTLAILLSFNIKQSARFNAAIVFIKLITIACFVLIASAHVNSKNWENFIPFGWPGVMEGAALVFFAYIGFDALSTAVDEAKNPQRDVPIGIIVSVIICTLLYVLVAALLTSIVPYTSLNVPSPVSYALQQIGHSTISGMIAAGAIAGLTSVILVLYYGLTRICLAMCLDGLLPKQLAIIHPKTHTPILIILSFGIIIAVITGLAPMHRAAELVNIGTLAAFTLVCLGSIVLRITHPDLPRPFKLPFYPIVPLLGIIFCFYLMLKLPSITWLRFSAWMFIGVIIYFFYSYRHSALAKVST